MTEDRLRQYALFLISKRSYLSAELKNKLVKKGFSLEAIDSLISLFQKKGYLDDAAFVRAFADKEKRKGISHRVIQQKLKKKGGSNIEVQETDAFDQEALSIYLKKCRTLLESRDPQVRQKLVRRLLQRGFSWEQIASVLK